MKVLNTLFFTISTFGFSGMKPQQDTDWLLPDLKKGFTIIFLYRSKQAGGPVPLKDYHVTMWLIIAIIDELHVLHCAVQVSKVKKSFNLKCILWFCHIR